jgi:PAS domain S-box-containing protein
LDEQPVPTFDQLQNENHVLRQHLATLGEIALAGEIPLDELLQKIVETSRSLLHARYAALGLFDANQRVTHFFTAGLSPQERQRIGSLPIGTGLLGLIVHERRIVRVPRIADHAASVGFPPNHPPMTSFLGGPIVGGDRVYGNLYLTDRLGAPEFTPDDAALLAILSGQAAAAIENAQRFASLRESERTATVLFATARDLLRQAQVERSSLEAIFDSLTDAVYTTALDGTIVRLNRRAVIWSGRASEECIGQLASDVFRFVDEARREDGPIPTESVVADERHSILLSKGERLPVEALVSPIRDDAGRVIGQVHVLRDLRPQWEVEQLKANIISLVSHELRTPLSHIKGYASTLLQPDVTWDPETQRDFIASIERQADRLARLIGDLLEISRLDAGGAARMELERVAPTILVERGVRLAQPNLAGHPITVSGPADLPPVQADPSHVERVLSNLIDNAAKYSPDGAPIAVSVRDEADGVVFAVRDRGPGLTTDERRHLFERFYRSPRVKHRTPGTGLGLAICREIVLAHGGRIWVDSAEGEGSTFQFSLPRASEGDR